MAIARKKEKQAAKPAVASAASPQRAEAFLATDSSFIDRAPLDNEVKSRVKHQLAVFDFDGTCLSCNSPVVLVRSLAAHREMSPLAVVRILCWAFAYKFQLPQREESARALVFSAFEGQPAKEVDAFLRDFYDLAIEKRFRPKADAVMREHASAGRDVVVVSASFEPMIERAMELHPFKYQVSTRMQVAEDGTYTRKVDGAPIEGEEKLSAVSRFANRTFGQGNWEIDYAYGDHHSDETILKAAKHAYAVTPDKPLARLARAEGWEILDWS